VKKIGDKMNEKTIQKKLIDTFQLFKDNIAIESTECKVTYAQLDKSTHMIARSLINEGIEKSTLIGILVENRLDFITAMLGILRAGCVFVPLDTRNPGNRLERMIEVTNTRYIICDNSRFKSHENSENGNSGEKGQTIYMKFHRLVSGETLIENPSLRRSPSREQLWHPNDQVYVYFTSGTTGKPRAILGKNISLLQFITWEIKTFRVDDSFRFSQLTFPGFDVILGDIFVPLCSGARICIPGNRVMQGSQQLKEWLDRQKINLVHCVPSLFRLLTDGDGEPPRYAQLKYILLAGERIHPAQIQKWYALMGNRVQLVNIYGPTETTLAKLFYFIRDADIHRKVIPVGKPIDGARVILLDEYMDICDQMVTGEIYIRTPYRSFGYCNDPGLTREKFIPNPFNHNPDDLIYKTGDLGRRLPDGNIELLGRVDRQVKIRGNRVKLEEIEGILMEHTDIREAVVVKKERDNGNEFLAAYIAWKDPGTTGTHTFEKDLETFLSAKLPSYMVPTHFRELEKLPRKANGKVDYQSLPNPVINQNLHVQEPRNEVEKKLRDIWSDILGINEIGVTTEFFQVGGNSISLMTMMYSIYKAFNVEISVNDIFNNNTIEKQATLLKDAKETGYSSLEPVEKKEYYRMSPAQTRMYFLQQKQLDSIAFNLPQVVRLHNLKDTRGLESTFRKLIQRQESLRTSFEVIDKVTVQRIHDTVEFEVEHWNYKSETVCSPPLNKNGQTGLPLQAFIRPFDVSGAPLLRVGLVSAGDTDYLLMVDMHHIISDGVSLLLLTDEFIRLYEGAELPKLKLQYKDYSQWLNSETGQQSLKQQEQYWLETFAAKPPPLDLPTDYPRPEMQTLEGDRLNFKLEKENLQALQTICFDQNVTMYILLLALFNVMLAKLSGREDIVVGSAVTGRNHADSRNVIGMFVNLLAMRNQLRGDFTFKQFLQDVRKRVLAALDNQDYPFDKLVEKLDAGKDISRHPILDVGFTLQNINPSTPQTQENLIPGANTKQEDSIKPGFKKFTSKIELNLLAVEYKDRLQFTFEYSTRLFKKETVEKFVMYFKNVVSAVIENIDVTLKDIDILPRYVMSTVRSEIEKTREGFSVEFNF
jgi:amino acid adenylation domain-containing protein